MKRIEFKYKPRDEVWIVPLGCVGEVIQACIDQHGERDYQIRYVSSKEFKKEWLNEYNLADEEPKNNKGFAV